MYHRYVVTTNAWLRSFYQLFSHTLYIAVVYPAEYRGPLEIVLVLSLLLPYLMPIDR